MRTFARRAANTWAGNSREACLGRLRNCCCAVSDSFMKLAQVGSIANKANAADAKSRAADCSVIGPGLLHFGWVSAKALASGLAAKPLMLVMAKAGKVAVGVGCQI